RRAKGAERVCEWDFFVCIPPGKGGDFVQGTRGSRVLRRRENTYGGIKLMSGHSKRFLHGLLTLVLLLALMAPGVMAQRTTIVFWHAMSGALGEAVQYLVDTFNESQDEFFVEAVYRGSYEETMVAAVAATRAGNPPHIVQVYEVGTRQMLDSGVIYPVYQLMADYGIDIDWDAFIGPVRGYYEFQGNLYSMPFNSSSPIMYYNKDAFRAAGLDPEKPPT